MNRHLRRLVLTGVLMVVATVLLGAEPEIALEVQSPAVLWRANAPFPLTVSVSRRGPGVLSGRLEFRFTDGDALVGMLRTAELAFANAEQSYRILVPPLQDSTHWEQLSAKIRFVGDGRDADLGERLLFVAPKRGRTYLVGVCVSETTNVAARHIANGLRLEQFMDFANSASQSTIVGDVPRTELSSDPFHYCLYDLLLVDTRILDELGDEQTRALELWVKAGGRLFVIWRQLPSRRTQAFLDRLERSSSGGDWPKSNPAGRRQTAEGLPAGDFVLRRAGLGRLVIAFRSPRDEELGTRRWKTTAAFLWNLPQAETDRILRPPRRTFRMSRMYRRIWVATRSGASMRWTTQPEVDERSAEVDDWHAKEWIVGSLLPSEVQTIPSVVIGVILAAFAFVVGPLDYLMLGFFRRRRLTWIFFPLTCIAFSVLTLRLSEAHLGEQDIQRSMTFVDIGRGGEVLRTSQYRLLFTAKNGQKVSQGVDEMRTRLQSGHGAFPTRSRGLGSSSRANRGRRRYEEGDLPVYEGHFPRRYALDYRARQWTPYLERSFRLGGESVPDLDWDALESLDGTDVFLRDRVRERLLGDRVVNGSVFVLNRGEVHVVKHDMARDLWSAFVETCLFERPVPPSEPAVNEPLHPLVAPSGGPGFGDLALLDPGNPREFLVVVVEEAGDDLILHRRLYYGGPP